MQEFMLPLECTVGKVCVAGTLYSENAVANSNLRLKVNCTHLHITSLDVGSFALRLGSKCAGVALGIEQMDSCVLCK